MCPEQKHRSLEPRYRIARGEPHGGHYYTVTCTEGRDGKGGGGGAHARRTPCKRRGGAPRWRGTCSSAAQHPAGPGTRHGGVGAASEEAGGDATNPSPPAPTARGEAGREESEWDSAVDAGVGLGLGEGRGLGIYEGGFS